MKKNQNSCGFGKENLEAGSDAENSSCGVVKKRDVALSFAMIKGKSGAFCASHDGDAMSGGALVSVSGVRSSRKNQKNFSFEHSQDVKIETAKNSKFKNVWNKVKYAVVPLIIFVAVLVLTYYGNVVIYWLRGGGYALQFHKLPIDDEIPLVTWFIYFYFLTFPAGIFAFFYVAYHDRRTLSDIFYTLIISFLISGVIYLCFETHLTKPDFIPNDFTGKIVSWTWGATDDAINNFPSQHAFMAIAMILASLFMSGDKKTWLTRVLLIVISIFVILSTFFTKQHYFIDWVASACIMIPTFFIVRARRKKKERENPNYVPLAKYDQYFKGRK